MTEYDTALSVIRHEIESGEDILDALNLAVQVIRDDRTIAAETRVDLTKPVSLVKRPRAGEAGSFENLFHILLHADRAPIDCMKYVGKHAASYHPENERYNNAECNRDRFEGRATNVLDCPECSPETYPARHAYQINMF